MNSTRKRMRLLVVFTLLMSALALQTTKAGILSVVGLSEDMKKLPLEIQHKIVRQVIDYDKKEFYPLDITENTKCKTLFSYLLYHPMRLDIGWFKIYLRPNKKKVAFPLGGGGKILILDSGGLWKCIWKFTVCRGPESPVYFLHWSPDGKKLAAIFRDNDDTDNEDGTVCIWNEEGKLIAQWKHKNVVSLDWTPKGDKLASFSKTTGYHAGEVWIWDENKGQKSASLKHTLETLDCKDFSLSSDGHNIAALVKTSLDCAVYIWNERGQRKEVLQNVLGRFNLCTSIHWNPTEKKLALPCDGSRKAFIWDEKNHSTFVCKGEGHNHWVSVKWSPSGECLACGNHCGGFIQIWDLNGNTLATCRGHRKLIRSLRWSPDGEKLISSSIDGTIRTWNIGNYLQGRLTLEQVILLKCFYEMARQQVNTLTDLAKRINTNNVDPDTGEPLLSKKNKVTALELRRILKSFEPAIEKALCERYNLRDNTWSAYAELLKNKYVATFIAVALVYWLKKRGSLPWLTMGFVTGFVRKILVSCKPFLKNKYVIVCGILNTLLYGYEELEMLEERRGGGLE